MKYHFIRKYVKNMNNRLLYALVYEIDSCRVNFNRVISSKIQDG